MGSLSESKVKGSLFFFKMKKRMLIETNASKLILKQDFRNDQNFSNDDKLGEWKDGKPFNKEEKYIKNLPLYSLCSRINNECYKHNGDLKDSEEGKKDEEPSNKEEGS